MKKPIFLLCALMFFLFSCKEGDKDKNPAEIQKEAIITELSKSGEFSEFVAELEKVNMSNPGHDAFTVLAVRNGNMVKSSALKATADFDIERYIVIGIWTPGNLTDGLILIALNGIELHVKVSDGDIYINGVLLGDWLTTGNSIIYFIDSPIPSDYLNVAPETLTFTKDGGTRQINIESNIKWAISSSQTWCAVSISEGSYNAIPDIIVTANTLNSVRFAVVTLTAGNLVKTIQITQSGTGGADVYVAGYGSGYARYWKNGVLTKLTDEKYSSHAYSVFVTDNGDVYVAGYEKSASGILVAKYWKNGDPATLGNGTNDSEARDIKVIGNDIYVTGYQRNTYNIMVARYWKNGLAKDLTSGTTMPGRHAVAHSLTVADQGVYVAGYKYTKTNSLNDINYGIVDAKYWINGETATLSNGLKHAEAYSIAVKGTDIHIAGYDYETGTIYWKNGAPVISASGNIAKSVCLVGTDVYLAGYDSNIAKYWKNGVAVTLTDGSKSASAHSIYVADSDIYVAGNEGGAAKYWKNGVAVELPGGATAESIFVK